MPVVLAHLVWILFAATSGAAGVSSARHSESGALAQERIGLELTPVGIGLLNPPADGRMSDRSPSPFGLGVSIRLLRHRWTNVYAIPLQAGLYWASNAGYVYVQAEGGLIVPGTGRRVELGLAAGLGMLGMSYAGGCDGNCAVGGAGLMLSPVARFLFAEGAWYTAGGSFRMVIPVEDGKGGTFAGDLTGSGQMFLVSLELGLGSSP